MDINAVPWQTYELWSISFLILAALVSTGFPVEYFFRSKWRTDHGAKLILLSKGVLAATLHAAWMFNVAYHAGWEPDNWTAGVVNCSFYSAIAMTQGAMWMWMRRILSGKELRFTEGDRRRTDRRSAVNEQL